jgi:hypothetical protein
VKPFDLVFDPIMALFYKCTLKGNMAYHRQRILEKGHRKTARQFDVVSLLSKINLSFNVLKNIVSKE